MWKIKKDFGLGYRLQGLMKYFDELFNGSQVGVRGGILIEEWEVGR